MKIWITKYALAKGIHAIEGEVSENFSSMAKGPNPLEYYHKPYWHTSKEEAVKHAEKIRLKKIKSLKAQIVKLEKLKFGEEK